MIVDCSKCGENDFTLRLTKKMNLQCICNTCGESFKLKLAKKHRVIRWKERLDDRTSENDL